MNPTTTRHRSIKSLAIHMAIALILTLLGVTGVVYMIFVEDDPPALPITTAFRA